MPSRSSSPTTLVLGVGNPLMGDDGFGIHVVRRLVSEPLPDRVRLEDGATGGVDLLDRLVGFDRVILIDLVRGVPSTSAPGGVAVFALSDGVEILNSEPGVSLHGCSLGGLIRLAEVLGIELPEIVVVGFVGGQVTYSTELSPAAAAAIDRAVAAVKELIAGGTTAQARTIA